VWDLNGNPTKTSHLYLCTAGVPVGRLRGLPDPVLSKTEVSWRDHSGEYLCTAGAPVGRLKGPKALVGDETFTK
jgi:hypothetical protein